MEQLIIIFIITILLFISGLMSVFLLVGMAHNWENSTVKKKSTKLVKKVLIITYYFPPSGGAGVQRTLKFVKYLRDFGWKPVVLTVKNADYPIYDETLWNDVPPNIKIYHSKILEPYNLYRRFTGRVLKDIDSTIMSKSSKTEKISEWIRSAFFVPDARISWLFFAVPTALKIIRKENIKIIYSSAPPYTVHLIGLILKRLTNLPWIVDFRDSWIGWHTAPQWRPFLSHKLELMMEGSVLERTNKIIIASPGIKRDLLKRHDNISDKWSVIMNGYDEDDFANIVSIPKDDHFEDLYVPDRLTIIHMGSFYGDFNPEYLLQSLEELYNEINNLHEIIHFLFIGKMTAQISRLIFESPVRHLIDIIPYISHKGCIRYLLGTDISLLIIPDIPIAHSILTGKLFEYIGAGHPILALVPYGNAANLIINHGFGKVVYTTDITAIKNELKYFIKHKSEIQLNFKLRQNDGTKNQFERKYLTGKLAKILDEEIK